MLKKRRTGREKTGAVKLPLATQRTHCLAAYERKKTLHHTGNKGYHDTEQQHCLLRRCSRLALHFRKLYSIRMMMSEVDASEINMNTGNYCRVYYSEQEAMQKVTGRRIPAYEPCTQDK